eukprot:TRINITY_DN8157_c0_g1_i1.p1 TRINITY_DN8157_c0_g1~~TRINITY_DN8157_c0_g1_i1.p1  ORF type:complete len:1505 (+),score=437.53 TRINITY_DN8157_c0_g1_i1:80-4594(+)
MSTRVRPRSGSNSAASGKLPPLPTASPSTGRARAGSGSGSTWRERDSLGGPAPPLPKIPAAAPTPARMTPPTPPLEATQRRALGRFEQELQDKFEIDRLEKLLRSQEERLHLRQQLVADREKALRRAHDGELVRTAQAQRQLAVKREMEVQERRKREAQQQAEDDRLRLVELRHRRRMEAEHLAQEEANRKRRQMEAERINREEADRREQRRKEEHRRREAARAADDRPTVRSPAQRAAEERAAAVDERSRLDRLREEEELASLESRLQEMMRPSRTVAEIRADRIRRGLAAGTCSPSATLPPRITSPDEPAPPPRDILSAPGSSEAPPVQRPTVEKAPKPPLPTRPAAAWPQPPEPKPANSPPPRPQPQRVQPAPQQCAWAGISTLERALEGLEGGVPTPLRTLFQLIPIATGDDLANLRRFIDEHPSMDDYPSLHLLASVLPAAPQEAPAGYGLRALRATYSASVPSSKPCSRLVPGIGTSTLFDSAYACGLMAAPLQWLAAASGNNAPLALSSALMAPSRHAPGHGLGKLLKAARESGGVRRWPRLMLLADAPETRASAAARARASVHVGSALQLIVSINEQLGAPAPAISELARISNNGRGLELCCEAAGEHLPFSRGILALVTAKRLGPRDPPPLRGTGYGLRALADAQPGEGFDALTAKRGIVALSEAECSRKTPLLSILSEGGRGHLLPILCGIPPAPRAPVYQHLKVPLLEMLLDVAGYPRLAAAPPPPPPNRRCLSALRAAFTSANKDAQKWPHCLRTAWPRQDRCLPDPRRLRRPSEPKWPHTLSYRLWRRGPLEEPVQFSRNRENTLSTWHSAPLVVAGVTWPTLEHYFQGQKFAGTPDEDEIRAAPSCEVATEWGRQRHRPLRSDWEAVKRDQMLKAQRMKFAQHPHCARALLETGTRPLVFRSQVDAYWGWYEGRGLNVLGAILSRVRRELRERQSMCGGLLADGTMLHDGLLPVKDLSESGGSITATGDAEADAAAARAAREALARAKRTPQRLLLISSEYDAVAGVYIRGRNHNLRASWSRHGGGARIFADERGYWVVAAAEMGGGAKALLESKEPCAKSGDGPLGVNDWLGYDSRLERWHICGARMVQGFHAGDAVEVCGMASALECAEGEVVEQNPQTGAVIAVFRSPHGMLQLEPVHLRPCDTSESDEETVVHPTSAAGSAAVLHGGLLSGGQSLNEGVLVPLPKLPVLHGGVLGDGGVLCEGVIASGDEFPHLADLYAMAGGPSVAALGVLMQAAQGTAPPPEDPIPQAPASAEGPLAALRHLLRCFDSEARGAPALAATVLCGPGAGVAKLMDIAGSSALAPTSLMVLCDARPHVNGVYNIGQARHNDMPTWVGRRSRIYVNDSGEWVIAAAADGEREMRSILESARGHDGLPPHRAGEWLMYEPHQSDWVMCSARVLESLAPGTSVEAVGVPGLEGLRGEVVEQYPPDGATAVRYPPPTGVVTVQAEWLRGHTGLAALCRVAGAAYGESYGLQLNRLLRPTDR